MPWIFPLPPGSFHVGSHFGLRRAPIGPAKVEDHNGQDFRAPAGTPVLAVDAGAVVVANHDPVNISGLYVILKHDDGKATSYCHLSRIDAELGARVKQGQQIGLVGTTGKSTGPHLHFVARANGRCVDPLSLLPPPPEGSHA